MFKWFFSLQFRLVMVFAIVLMLSLASANIYVRFVAIRDAENLQQQIEERRISRLKEAVSDYYETDQRWLGVQSVLDRMGVLYNWHIIVTDQDGGVVGKTSGFAVPPEKLRYVDELLTKSPTMGKILQVEDGWDVVIPDTEAVEFATKSIGMRDKDLEVVSRRLGQRPPHPSQRRLASRIRSNGREVGSIVVDTRGVSGVLREPNMGSLVSALNESLLWSGFAVGLGGIIIVSLVSRRIFSSVRVLNSTAKRFGSGDLSQRVPDSSLDELGELSRTFNSMAEKLENNENRRRKLAADVAHELRTPLSNIQGYVEALRDGVFDADKSTLETIHQQVLHLAQLVEDQRMLSEAEEGDFRLDMHPEPMLDVVKKSVDAFTPRAEAQDIRISVEAPVRLPLVVMDRTRISQVIDNLLENAIRYASKDCTVLVDVRGGEGNAVSVTVTDDGSGMPEEDLPFVFDRYYRVDSSRTRATGGAGLGLTVVKQLVDMHGGRVQVESTLGKGSQFTFELPVSET